VVAAKPALLQFEFDPGELGVAKEQDGYTLRLDSRRERPIEGGVDLQFTLTTPGQPGQPNGAAVALPPAFAGCVLRLNVKQDDGAEIEIEETTVTTAGAPATVEPDGTTRRQLTCRAYGIPEGATLRKVICSLFHRGHETKLIPFSFQNVPLPTPDE
ncbi:MAG: hypothetical protein ACE5JM_07445, partial [Armatimonadota bacterium]